MSDHGCDHLQELMKCERDLIKRHIAEHKWCNGIADFNEGVKDFAKKYAWVMREFYCGYVCESRKDCTIAKEFLPVEVIAPEAPEKEDPDTEATEATEDPSI